MGSHTFKWEHPAEEVYVTGTFDNWTKSVKLEKDGDVFQKTVELEDASKKIYYKFVVDNTWTTNDSAPKEPDHDGNINNFLTPEQIITSPAAAALINTVTPDSTTAAMAGQQSKKKKNKKSKNNNPNKESQSSLATTETTQSKGAEEVPTPADIPGGFPITPAAELDRPVGINPLPAAEGAVNPVTVEAGEKIPQSVAAQDLNANVKLDKESYEKSDALPGGLPAAFAAEAEKPVSINPLPAAAGAVNPIQLAPGEKVPQSVAAQDINANVKLDKESYEKSDTLPGVQTEVPAVSKNIIPESGLPVGDATINSVTPTATTAILAGNVPLEPKVPKIVKESQEQAGVPPEASAIAEEVKEKAAVEEELKAKVPEAPSTSEGTSGLGTEKSENTGTIAAAAATAGGAVIAAVTAAAATVAGKAAPVVDQASAAADQAAATAVDVANKNLPDSVKETLPESAQQVLASHNKEEIREQIAPEVPDEVKQSITEAAKSPEAAANAVAVEDKKEVEAELLKEVKEVPAVGAATVPEAKTAQATEAAPTTAAAPTTVAAPTTAAAPAIAEAPKVEETPKAEAPKVDAAANGGEAPKAEAASNGAEAPKAEAASNGAGASNGTGSKPEASKTAEASTEKKKKNRFSAILSKIKHKITDKN
ncbi:unnamed protein product [Clonostachys byssicola]|uniref:AMP-activated protein kinase glycogen-binding domain-containing protein n=1 Tax=Clonostachys byssicola TaxID=160290 RepID=A0A9N9UV56_9HYPO|nr:unnamed protein product [Clonostachys byssicola]